jgi:hypothetical protein
MGRIAGDAKLIRDPPFLRPGRYLFGCSSAASGANPEFSRDREPVVAGQRHES